MAELAGIGASADWISATPSQVEWAERIQRQVNAEFDRVAASFRAIAGKQSDGKRADTQAWQEIGDQVRQMIFHDPCYQAIQSNSSARRR
ncbi:MAG TPA: hypothetical protein VMB25_15525 [Bryobacteraceae bacterium]|nr:hypothetical protein [Bryobacteraceae bacterium]